MFTNEVNVSSGKIAKESSNPSESTSKTEEVLEMKRNLIKLKRKEKETFNQGRWTLDEHERFLEAIFKFGNKWKRVQSHIRTRSATQARSHAQKFFFRLKNKLFHNNSKKLFTKFEKEMDSQLKAEFEKTFQLLKSSVKHDYTDFDDLLRKFFAKDQKEFKSNKKQKPKMLFKVEKSHNSNSTQSEIDEINNYIQLKKNLSGEVKKQIHTLNFKENQNSLLYEDLFPILNNNEKFTKIQTPVNQQPSKYDQVLNYFNSLNNQNIINSNNCCSIEYNPIFDENEIEGFFNTDDSHKNNNCFEICFNNENEIRPFSFKTHNDNLFNC